MQTKVRWCRTWCSKLLRKCRHANQQRLAVFIVAMPPSQARGANPSNQGGEMPQRALSGRAALIGSGDDELAQELSHALQALGATCTHIKLTPPASSHASQDIDEMPATDFIMAALARARAVNIDIFVHLPSPLPRHPLVALPIAGWTSAIALGLTAPFLISRAMLPAMSHRQWGRIIFATTDSSCRCDQRDASQATIDAGLEALARCIDNAAAPFGVRCSTVMKRDERPSSFARSLAYACLDGPGRNG